MNAKWFIENALVARPIVHGGYVDVKWTRGKRRRIRSRIFRSLCDLSQILIYPGEDGRWELSTVCCSSAVLSIITGGGLDSSSGHFTGGEVFVGWTRNWIWLPLFCMLLFTLGWHFSIKVGWCRHCLSAVQNLWAIIHRHFFSRVIILRGHNR